VLLLLLYSVLLYSKVALSLKQFGIGHRDINTFSLRMTDTMTSQNIDLSSWDTLYNHNVSHQIRTRM
jgi:hypothetical protein